ncbi:MAG: hypothetical protein MJA83_08475, partial [Gammaproteobacteria bacterium]|nr:hypothetical protein [Gammaproteobacteria bacterium]
FGEDIDNSAQFTAANSNISGRTPTTALVDWTPATTWTNDDIETTPDIANIVQEIVNRGNWNANNAMTFFIVGTGERRASSHNQSVAEAAVLNINYTAAGVTASRALAMDDDPTGPAAGQAHAIPGATVEYTLTVTNETTVNLDSGATVVCYDVPANTQILMDGYTGTPDMPIDLANNTSGLSFTYGGPSDGTDSLVFYDDVDCAAGTGSAVTPNASTGTASNVGSVEITFNGSFTASDTVTDPAVDVLMKVIID